MPCRSYDDDFGYGGTIALREKLDKLSRIACKALYLLEERYPEDFSRLMKDKETAEWWPKHKEADRREKIKADAAKAKRKEQELAKAAVMAKLTEEELAAFGLVNSGKTSGRKR